MPVSNWAEQGSDLRGVPGAVLLPPVPAGDGSARHGQPIAAHGVSTHRSRGQDGGRGCGVGCQDTLRDREHP